MGIKRIRPAAEKLIEAEDTVKLERFAGCGWFGGRELDGFIRTARERGKTASLLWLLHCKDRLRHGGPPGLWLENTAGPVIDDVQVVVAEGADSGKMSDGQEGEVSVQGSDAKWSMGIVIDRMQLARTVLAGCRNDLYRWYPSLDAAFAGIVYKSCSAGAPVWGIGTDGDAFFYEPQFVLEMYAANPARLRRGYLHMLLHCLYLHPFADVGRGVVGADGTYGRQNLTGAEVVCGRVEDLPGVADGVVCRSVGDFPGAEDRLVCGRVEDLPSVADEVVCRSMGDFPRAEDRLVCGSAEDLPSVEDRAVRGEMQNLSDEENESVCRLPQGLRVAMRGADRRRLWDLACDIAVEQIIEREGIEALADDEEAECEADSVRKSDVLQKLQSVQNNVEIKWQGVFSAEQLYRLLCQGAVPYPVEELERVFRFDDHSLWGALGQNAHAAGRGKWEKIRAHAGAGQEAGSLLAGLGEGSDSEDAGEIRRSSFDYRKFLSRFTVTREEVELDTESFDYIFYSYGMEHYGNLPLIEPLEYREVNRLEELVIAIDTSGSCSAEMVRQFLAGTYAILSEKENFFRKMEVHLIQCDCAIQSVTVIHSEEEWRQAAEHIVIRGRGGTDFTPVFRYIRAQQEKKELRRFRALLYFTDGDGVYPSEKPEYETAFVFVRRTRGMELVPMWARTLVADSE